jgi:hypothetical protein
MVMKMYWLKLMSIVTLKIYWKLGYTLATIPKIDEIVF